MTSNFKRGAGLLLAAAALAAPASASASGLDTAVAKVQAHTDRADAALERAAAAFARSADRRGKTQLSRSRKQMGLATAAAAKLLRDAQTTEERIAAARALALLARQRDENVETLVATLTEVDGHVETRIAALARTDTRGREKAITILAGLAAILPGEAAGGIAMAMAVLGTDRADEVETEARALGSSRVGAKAKGAVAAAVEASVDGQREAADRVAALLADEDMPAESKPGLQAAYDAITADHGSVADVLSRFSDRMPAFVRSFVMEIVQQARENAQAMRDSRPGPPAGPGGKPEGTPSGKPAGTPGP